MGDSDEDVQGQAFNHVVRNLTESEDGIAVMFKEVGKEVLSCVTAGLSIGNSIVLQVFYIFLLRIFKNITDTIYLFPRQPLYSPTCRMEHSNKKI